ncbi:MAG: DNA repair protein RecO [Gemmatimonadetes bacterium]|nr:DNA repair protein RecO [Gemmatimonadota bacterium]
MAVTTTDAVLLRAHAYGETSRVLRFLTRDRGIVGVMARGVRSTKRGHGLATFASGQLTLYHKATRDLQTYKEFAVVSPRRGLGTDPLRLAAASVLADLVLRHGGDAEAGDLYDALAGALDRLEGTPPAAIAGVLLREGWGLVAELGYRPELDRCPLCGRELAHDEMGRFDFSQGGVRCADCATGGEGPRIGPGARLQVGALLAGAIPDDLERPRAHLQLLSDFITYHVAGSRPLDTFRILAALLPPEAT